MSGRTLLFLILSGLATGASWLCYFKALQIGDVNKVTPIDKSSTVLTMILAFVLLGEKITAAQGRSDDPDWCWYISYGSQEKRECGYYSVIPKSNLWLIYAFGAAIFASMTAILGKVGIEGIESNLGTAIRTIVVLIMAWIIVFVTKKQKTIKEIDQKSWIFLVLSGFATGGSWLCYYRALQSGPASVVVPIDKLSIVFTIAFSYFFLKEKLTVKSTAGLALIVTGTLSLLL